MKSYKVRPLLIDSSVPSDLLICSVDKYLHKTEHYGCIFESPYGEDKYVELILISLEDEKIEEGDEFVHYWFNENSTNKDRIVVSTADKNTNDKKHRKSFIGKVIARQSQIPQEYITKFIEQYNNGCVEDLEIDMKEIMVRYVLCK